MAQAAACGPPPPRPPTGPDDEWTPADLLKHFNADCLAWRLEAGYGCLNKNPLLMTERD